MFCKGNLCFFLQFLDISVCNSIVGWCDVFVVLVNGLLKRWVLSTFVVVWNLMNLQGFACVLFYYFLVLVFVCLASVVPVVREMFFPKFFLDSFCQCLT